MDYDIEKLSDEQIMQVLQDYGVPEDDIEWTLNYIKNHPETLQSYIEGKGKPFDYNEEQILQALHYFGLSDEEIKNSMDYVREHPELIERFRQSRGKNYSNEDIKPYEFPRAESQSGTEEELTDGASNTEDVIEDEYSQVINPYDTYEFKEFGYEDAFDYEAWKKSTERKMENKIFNYPEEIDDITYDKFRAMKAILIRLERFLIKEYSEFAKNPDNAIAGENLEYFKCLQSVLQNKMFEMAPADFISSLNWSENGSDVKRYDISEAEQFIYHYNCANAYDKKYQEIFNEIQQFESKHPNMTDREENEQAILSAQEMFFDIKRSEHMSQVPINIEKFRTIRPGAEPEMMAEKHTAYIERLLEQAKAIQAKQVELLSSYEVGDLKVNPEAEVQDLQGDFKRINNKMSYLKQIGDVLGLAKDDKEVEEQEDGIIKASGKDILALMNSKQKYKAIKSVHTMKRNGKAPGWFKRQVLRLPTKNTDELIAEYIDYGDLDVEEILGYSREEIGVMAKAKRVAKEIREEREKEAYRPNTLPKEESEEVKEEVVTSGEEQPEIKDSEGETVKEETTGTDEVDRIVDEIMDKFDELSEEGQIEFYAKQYGLDENEKQILKLFTTLSQEAKEKLWQNMYGKEEMEKEPEEKTNR